MINMRRLSFTYINYGLPLVPINFFYPDREPTRTYTAILDSGSEKIVIPKSLSDELKLKLNPIEPVDTGGGETNAYTSNINFNLGRDNNIVKYNNIDICVLDKSKAILVGIDPVFNDYKVVTMAYENKINFNQRKIKRTFVIKDNRYTADITKEDDCYVAICKENGCADQGYTLENALQNIKDSIKSHIESFGDSTSDQ